MAKILFAHPLFLSKSPAELASASPYFPLGVLYLASYVRDAGHAVSIFDGTFAKDESAFAEALEHERPDGVGISALLPTRETALTLAQMACDRGALVLLGGPDPTLSPEVYATHAAVDLVVHHEGEQTVTAVLDRVDGGGLSASGLGARRLDDVALDPHPLAVEPGVAFLSGGELVINEPRPPIENLDSLPLPARDLIDMERYLEQWEETSGYSSLTITTSRGCPYGCEWCRAAVHGSGFRQRSPESVAAEMKALKERYPVTRLRMVDDVDGLDRAWLEAWADAAEELDAAIPFEALDDLERQDIPLLDVRDTL